MKRPTTLVDVARAANVSLGTASNAFSRPERVRPSLRAKVEAAARDLGYAGPSPKGRLLMGGQGYGGEIGHIPNDYLPKVRARLERELQIPPQHVLINASHCHGVVSSDVDQKTFDAVQQAVPALSPQDDSRPGVTLILRSWSETGSSAVTVDELSSRPASASHGCMCGSTYAS